MTTNNQSPLVGLNTLPPKKRRVLLIAIIVAFVAVMVFMFSGILTEDTGDNRTEQDYITKTYVVKQIMERQILDHGSVKHRYGFIEPENEDFNLSLPIIVNESDNYEKLITIGDTVNVKIFSHELEEMQSGSIVKKFKRFLKNDNREVEVFKLTIKDKVIFSKDITWSDVNFRKESDLSVGPIFSLLVGLVIVAAIIGSVRRKINSKKK